MLVGLDAPDDAAVYALDAEHAIVSTVDFFTPIVDDPYTFGAIAAANAMSDIYAMGGRPLFALNIVAFPTEELGPTILVEILRGGRDKAAEAGVAIVGGHSIDDAEPKYGLAVVGVVSADRIFRKSDGRVGDRLVISKAVGTGVISTAIKHGNAPAEAVDAAVRSMLRLNRDALQIALEHDLGTLTDVTGYGVLGHLAELARQSGLAVQVEAEHVPTFPQALELAGAGQVPGGTRRNLEFVASQTTWAARLSEAWRLLLCDAQTSGGLILTVAPSDAARLVKRLRKAGHTAAEVGRLVEGAAGSIEVL